MIRVMSPEDCTKLLRIPKNRYFTGRRNKLIMMLMLDLGLRISEVVGHEKRVRLDGTTAGGLRIRDVNLETGQITLYDTKDTRSASKRRKTIKAGRILYASGRLLESLKKWYEVRKMIDPCGPDDLLIVTHEGKKVDNRYVRNFVHRYAQRAGISITVTPHRLRHAFASSFYHDTHDLRLLQDILGHSSVKVTEGYVQLPEDEIKKVLVERQMNRKYR